MVKLAQAFKYSFLIAAFLIAVFPFYWMIISATNTIPDILRGSLLPGLNMIQNWVNLLKLSPLRMAFTNSVIYSLSVTFVSLLICSLAGYGFEVYHSKAKDRFMSFLLVSVMVPFAAVMIPLVQLVSGLGLRNTTLGFMLPMLSSAFLIMLFRQSSRAFPIEMIEAARVDGLSEVSIFFTMYVPTMKATFAAGIVIQFLSSWNAFLWPRLIMTPGGGSITMPMLLINLQEGHITDQGALMLAALISSVPTMVVFFMLQRYFAQGLTGTIK